MSISAIQGGGINPIPEVRNVPAAAPAEEVSAGEGRIVPEERAFDRYEPENGSRTTTCSTDAVDREIEQLKQRQERLEGELRTAAPEREEAVRQELARVERELAQKDNDSYRRQQAVFS